MRYARNISIFSIFASLLIGLSAQAHTVRSQKHCGKVESIDYRARTLTITCATHKHTSKVRVPPWRSVAAAAELKEGDEACVYFRQPLFGKPVATKVAAANS